MNLTHDLGLILPLIQAPLTYYPNTSGLVAKISECGALGTYCTSGHTLKEITDDLNDITLRTHKPFAAVIDISANQPTAVIHEGEQYNDDNNNHTTQNNDNIIDGVNTQERVIYTPENNIDVDNIDLMIAYEALNTAHGDIILTPSYRKVTACVMEHSPAVIIYKNGIPDDSTIQEVKRGGAIVVAFASNILEVLAINNSRIDAIILQGCEAAGTLSQFSNDMNLTYYPTNTLLHHAVKNSAKPLIVWGDYQHSANIVGALVNGASAVMIDMPFWTTHESPIPEGFRERLSTHTEMSIQTTNSWFGHIANTLSNELTRALCTSHNLSPVQQYELALPVIRAAIEQNNTDYMPLWAGLCAHSSNKRVSELCDKYAAELGDMIG